MSASQTRQTRVANREEEAGAPAAVGNADAKVAPNRGFETTSVWVFDLDNTLYPAACNLFAEVDMRMGTFIAKHLGLPFAQARHLQKSYYRQFGTTLSGLMQVHNLDPQPFLDYVHDIDLSALREAPQLAAALDTLPGRKLIFTNGSRRHAERVAEKLGIAHLFEDICDTAACGYVPKPELDAFNRMMRRHGVTPPEAAMFEDMPHNLEAPHALGMTTVLVQTEYEDHPSRLQMRDWSEPPEHIHHMTSDLTSFLGAISRAKRAAASSARPPTRS